MPKFTILWLFALTTILAVLFAVAAQSLQLGFLLSCLLLSSYAGFASRFLFLKSHATSITTTAITSIAVGAFLLAIGNRFSPINPATPDFLSDGGQSVGVSFFIGASLGYCFSLLPLLMYTFVVGWRGGAAE